MTNADAVEFYYEKRGFCPVCETAATFIARDPWFRGHLRCQSCNSAVRERALALVLNETCPHWRALSIHESSPVNQGISLKLKQQCGAYIATQYFPGQPLGETVRGFRNEDLEKQSFADQSFDIVVSLDVMEHVFQPGLVYAEIFRTLRPGGCYIHTFPIERSITAAAQPLAELSPGGTIRHLTEKPEYHGNPVSAEGSLVTYRYGYGIHQQIAEWAPFDVRVSRFWEPSSGIIGLYTEVVVCRRPALG